MTCRLKAMYADFASLAAISASVNIILGAIALVLASRTKTNEWSELFAAKLLGWFWCFKACTCLAATFRGTIFGRDRAPTAFEKVQRSPLLSDSSR